LLKGDPKGVVQFVSLVARATAANLDR